MDNPENKEFTCPGCNRPVVNRKLSNCLYCGFQIPDHFIFSDKEIQKHEEREQRSTLSESNNTGVYKAGEGVCASGGGFGGSE